MPAVALAIVGAIVYGVTQDGAMGTIGLVSAACALGFLAGINLFTRDANIDPADAAAVATAGGATRRPRAANGHSARIEATAYTNWRER